MVFFGKRGRRVPVRVPVSLSTLDVFLDSEIMNLSKGGVFIRADISLAVGTEVDLEFAIPDTSEVVRAIGTVVWSRKRDMSQKNFLPDHPPGMGIEFKSISKEELARIIEIIEKLIENS